MGVVGFSLGSSGGYLVFLCFAFSWVRGRMVAFFFSLGVDSC